MKIGVTEISRRLGISKATVSKALSGKPGVDENTKKNILKYAKSVGYFSNQPRLYDIALIMPAVYKGLCAVFQKIMKENGLEANCSIYSDKEDYIKSLIALTKSKPSICALYPMYCDEADNLIKKLGEVWFFGDLINMENAFYFGVNPKKEAQTLADSFKDGKMCAPIVISGRKSVVGSRRSEIFLRLLAENNVYHKGNILLYDNASVSSAFLARRLSRFVSAADSIYCADMDCVTVKGALKKLGREDIKIFSYSDEENLKNAVMLLVEKAKIFLESGEYPACKYNFV